MNRSQLPKLRDYRVRVRPIARRFDEDGSELDEIDDIWGVGQVSQDAVVLRNFRTGHVVPLKADAIHHYQEDTGDRRGILHLHVQVFLQGREAPVEPLAYPQRTVAHLPIRRRGRRRVVIPIAGTKNTTAEAMAVGILGLLVIIAVKGWGW